MAFGFGNRDEGNNKNKGSNIRDNELENFGLTKDLKGKELENRLIQNFDLLLNRANNLDEFGKFYYDGETKYPSSVAMRLLFDTDLVASRFADGITSDRKISISAIGQKQKELIETVRGHMYSPKTEKSDINYINNAEHRQARMGLVEQRVQELKAQDSKTKDDIALEQACTEVYSNWIAIGYKRLESPQLNTGLAALGLVNDPTIEYSDVNRNKLIVSGTKFATENMIRYGPSKNVDAFIYSIAYKSAKNDNKILPNGHVPTSYLDTANEFEPYINAMMA